MFKKILKYLFKDFYIFTMAYSNNVFKDPLSKEEEDEAVRLCLLGNKEARAKLIEHNLRLVAHIVKKYDNKSYDVDDLISIGTIGLIKGIDSYSFKHGTRITTYCARCIENEILMYYRNDKKNSKNVSIEGSIGFDKEGNEITFLDILKTPNPDFALDIHKNNNIKLLKKYLTVLNDREKIVLQYRYGFIDGEPKTLEEVGKVFDLTRERVRQIEKNALKKLSQSGTLKEFKPEGKLVKTREKDRNVRDYNFVLKKLNDERLNLLEYITNLETKGKINDNLSSNQLGSLEPIFDVSEEYESENAKRFM